MNNISISIENLEENRSWWAKFDPASIDIKDAESRGKFCDPKQAIAEVRELNGIKPREYIERTEKACSGCKVVKPMSEFHKCTNNVDGHEYHCKACIHIKNKERWRRRKA